MSTRIIKINRGDSYNFNINMTEKDSSEKHLLMADEVVYFALLYPHQRFEDAILIRGYTLEDQDVETGEIHVKIEPNDTRSLDSGVYYYTVKFKKGGTLVSVTEQDEPLEVRTLIDRTKFIIND